VHRRSAGNEVGATRVDGGDGRRLIRHIDFPTCAFACISSSAVERTYIDALSSTQMHVRRTSAAPACCTAPPCGSYPTPPAPQPPRAPPRPHQTRAGPPCPRHGRSSSDEAWRLWRDPQQLATWPQPTAAPGMSPNQPRRRMRGDAGKGLHVVGPPHLRRPVGKVDGRGRRRSARERRPPRQRNERPASNSTSSSWLNGHAVDNSS